MISSHLKDRFFQRFGQELTVDVLRELMHLAKGAKGVPDAVPNRERVTILWRGHFIRIVWSRERRFFFTFLPPQDKGLRIAECAPKRRSRHFGGR